MLRAKAVEAGVVTPSFVNRQAVNPESLGGVGVLRFGVQGCVDLRGIRGLG